MNDIDLNDPYVDLAYRRIDSLLRAYGINNAAIRSQESHRILHDTLIEAPINAELEHCAALKTFANIELGMDRIAQALKLEADEVDFEKLRLAIQYSKTLQAEPKVLLATCQLTQVHESALKNSYARKIMPDLQRTSMGASVLRFDTIDDVTTSTGKLFTRLPWLRKAATVLLASSILFLIYHFAK